MFPGKGDGRRALGLFGIRVDELFVYLGGVLPLPQIFVAHAQIGHGPGPGLRLRIGVDYILQRLGRLGVIRAVEESHGLLVVEIGLDLLELAQQALGLGDHIGTRVLVYDRIVGQRRLFVFLLIEMVIPDSELGAGGELAVRESAQKIPELFDRLLGPVQFEVAPAHVVDGVVDEFRIPVFPDHARIGGSGLFVPGKVE